MATPKQVKDKSFAIIINHKLAVRTLVSCIVLLTLMHLTTLFIYYIVDDPKKFDFVRLLDLDYEGNIPTLFSAFLFAVAKQQRDQIQWLGLGLVFLFLCFDEGAKMHEQVGDLMENYVDAKGFFYFPWFIPYLTAFAILTGLYFPFYLRLSRETKKDFFIAAFVFLLGAAVFDLISGREANLHGMTTKTYAVLYTIEEVLEMTGLVLFFSALFKLVKDENIAIKID